jgi:hypothetical protein
LRVFSCRDQLVVDRDENMCRVQPPASDDCVERLADVRCFLARELDLNQILGERRTSEQQERKSGENRRPDYRSNITA